jgi:hypothetical protein
MSLGNPNVSQAAPHTPPNEPRFDDHRRKQAQNSPRAAADGSPNAAAAIEWPVSLGFAEQRHAGAQL